MIHTSSHQCIVMEKADEVFGGFLVLSRLKKKGGWSNALMLIVSMFFFFSDWKATQGQYHVQHFSWSHFWGQEVCRCPTEDYPGEGPHR